MSAPGKSEWEIKYEQMKKERLEKEKAKYNPNIAKDNKKLSNSNSNLKFSPKKIPVSLNKSEDFQEIKNESYRSDKAFNKEQNVKQKSGSKASLVPNYNSDEESHNSYSSDQALGQTKSSTDIVIDRPGINRPSQQKNKDDPWFAAYEARKQAALKNFETKNLQSVVGASAFVGKIEGVSSLTSQNQGIIYKACYNLVLL